jgi:sterol desaturase/sphingolipid hydroxylase (fatty acid hydroxylase superfamily)
MHTDIDPTGTLALYALGVPLVLLLILVEAVLCNLKGWRYYQAKDTWCSLGLLAGNIVINAGLKASTLGLYLYLYQFRLFEIRELLPVWAVWLLSFVMIDLVFYWYHRMSHRVRFLWAVHMNHHSSEEMNFLVAFRQAWLGPVTKIPFFAALPLLGMDPTITLVAGVGATLWGVVGHTKIVDKLWPPLEWLFNTPSHHRVHHGSNAQYIDKNYGNLFIVWDRMFGTFEAEQEPVVYGLINNVATYNPVKITFMDWQALARKMRNAPSLRIALGYFFGPPGWEPPQGREEAAAKA